MHIPYDHPHLSTLLAEAKDITAEHWHVGGRDGQQKRALGWKVLADWLEEQGDPPRAEYLRLTARLLEEADGTYPPPHASPAYAEDYRRHGELRNIWGWLWLGPLRDTVTRGDTNSHRVRLDQYWIDVNLPNYSALRPDELGPWERPLALVKPWIGELQVNCSNTALPDSRPWECFRWWLGGADLMEATVHLYSQNALPAAIRCLQGLPLDRPPAAVRRLSLRGLGDITRQQVRELDACPLVRLARSKALDARGSSAALDLAGSLGWDTN